MSQSLMTVNYTDAQKHIRLSVYADTIVYGTVDGRNTLCAIRFGGYPEQVSGMAQVIYGGGDVYVETNRSSMYLRTLTKQYRRCVSHDGIYAEAVLIAEDENRLAQAKEQHKKTKEGDHTNSQQTESDLPPRNSFIFTAPGNSMALYDAIDQKTSVPMIPEFSGYMLSELQKAEILMPLKVLSSSVKFDAWLLRSSGDDANIIEIIEQGVKTGQLVIPGAENSNTANGFDTVKTVTDYLSVYGPQVAERIQNLFVPLFDPSVDRISPEVTEINETIREKAGYSLYDAQLAVAEAVKRQLQRGKFSLIIAECGAGKTKMGITAIAAAMPGQGSNKTECSKRKTFNIVLCPSHIKEKWVREIGESLPDTFAGIVNSISDFDKLYSAFAKGSKNCYAIISKEMARDGYMHAPAVVWSKRRKGFICPSCDSVIQVPVSEDGVKYYVDADQFCFKKQNRDNHKCPACGELLWTALNPAAVKKSSWYKISNYGFVYRSQAAAHLRKVDNTEFAEKINVLTEHPESIPNAVGAHRKYPLSMYIKKHYKGRIDGLIVDELQNYNNDSGQGDAMAELFGTAKKMIGMTGTLINGYASGIFYLLFRLMPKLMLEDGKAYNSPADFAAEYGVIENTYEVSEGDYNSNRRTVKRKKSSRQLPGVSPLVYSKFLLEHAAFLSLADMGKDLPEYEEIPVPLKMPENVAEQYKKIQDALLNVLKSDKSSAKKILSAYLNLLTAYPDQPYGQPAVLHPVTGGPIVEPPDITDFDTVLPKDEAILDLVKRKVNAGERVLVYTNWTRLDTQKKLKKLLSEAGFRVEILPSTVKPDKRERWVENCVAKGVQVLITNPALLETGLDLIAFTTLIFYDTGYKLFTLRQASRRSWRINQTFPRIEVYMLYYKDTMQHKAIKLMASKLAVAGIIEGGFSEEGLAAMSQCDDMTSQMAKELMLGIKDSVEDVSAAFKRMARKKDIELPQDIPLFSNKPVDIVPKPHGNRQAVEFTFTDPVMATTHTPVIEFTDISTIIPNKAKKRRTIDINQFSFFESIA